jgi:glycosyltransferase involved in cell wall biosynthesis
MKTGHPPSVTVVIPAFNRAGTIRAAVESVLSQSYADLELLVVDDGSTDGTMSTLAEITDPRLRLLANPGNMGPSAARNTGIQASRGDWVAFQDSDDEWLPDKLAKQMAQIALTGPGCIAAYCGMLIDTPKDGSLGPDGVRYYPDASLGKREGNLLEPLLRRSLISTQTLVARRDALLKIGGFDESLPALEDWDCVLRLARLGTFAFVDEPLVKQYFSPNSITRNRAKWASAREQVVTKNLDLLQDRPAVLAGHYRSIAGESRRLGQLGEAKSAIRKALGATPGDPKLWLLASYLWALNMIAPPKG